MMTETALIDCNDGDCNPSQNVDFTVVNTECDTNTGQVIVNNANPGVEYYTVMNGGQTNDISANNLPAGDYTLFAIGMCDTTEISLTIGYITQCDTMDPCDTEHPDYSALMELYSSAGGESWDDNNGWTEGAEGVSCDPCDHNGAPWFGIVCNAGRVREVNLRDKQSSRFNTGEHLKPL